MTCSSPEVSNLSLEKEAAEEQVNESSVDHQHPLGRVERVGYPLSKVSSSSLVNRENDVRESSPLVGPTVARF